MNARKTSPTESADLQPTSECGAVLLVQNGNYLLQLRDNIPTIASPGKYSLWGGGVEGNETPLQCAVRELQEETGVHLPASEFIWLLEDVYEEEHPLLGLLRVKMHVYVVELSADIAVHCYEGTGPHACDSLQELGIQNCTDELVAVVRAYEAYKKV